jgi:uncharacterized protein YjiS (DUF1127 family)
MAHVAHRSASTPVTLGSFATNIQKRLAVWRSRRDLAQLDDHALEDIGITPEQARAEARLSVWDVPANWRGR